MNIYPHTRYNSDLLGVDDLSTVLEPVVRGDWFKWRTNAITRRHPLLFYGFNLKKPPKQDPDDLHKVVKVRLYPTANQVAMYRGWLGVHRLCYNAILNYATSHRQPRDDHSLRIPNDSTARAVIGSLMVANPDAFHGVPECV